MPLTITLPPNEDNPVAQKIQLEHSLVSISKWESIHTKPFFGKPGDERTEEEMADYIKHMVLGEVPIDFFERLTMENLEQIGDYINGTNTATTFREDPNKRPNNEVVTSELVYYWMISFQIPFECETWHFNRLMTLIQICGLKQSKPKKMSRQAQAEQYRRLNAQRRQQLGTAG